MRIKYIPNFALVVGVCAGFRDHSKVCGIGTVILTMGGFCFMDYCKMR